MDQQRQLDNHEHRIERLETWCTDVSGDIGYLRGAASSTKRLAIIIMMLIILVAGLVGIKLFVPGF